MHLSDLTFLTGSAIGPELSCERVAAVAGVATSDVRRANSRPCRMIMSRYNASGGCLTPPRKPTPHLLGRPYGQHIAADWGECFADASGFA